MYVLHENSRPKKRPRDALGSFSDDFCEETERERKRNCITREDNHTGHWPPGFYDRLSKVHLTRGALREFERRTAQSKLLFPPIPNSCTFTSSEPTNQQLKRFSRHGGPDLTHVRGVSAQKSLESGITVVGPSDGVAVRSLPRSTGQHEPVEFKSEAVFRNRIVRVGAQRLDTQEQGII